MVDRINGDEKVDLTGIWVKSERSVRMEKRGSPARAESLATVLAMLEDVRGTICKLRECEGQLLRRLNG